VFSSTGGGSRLVVAAARIGKAVCIWSQIFWSSAAGKPISTKAWSHILSKASTHVAMLPVPSFGSSSTSKPFV